MRIGPIIATGCVVWAGFAGAFADVVRSEAPHPSLKDCIIRTQSASLGGATLTLRQTFKNGALFGGPGAKYEFGFQHGRRPGYNNGSWDIWNFFTCFRPMGKRTMDVLRENAPESFVLSTCGDARTLDIAVPAGTDGARLRLRFLAFDSQPHWIFARFRVEGFTPLKFKLGCYPATTRADPSRELWATYLGGAANLGRDGMDIARPKMNGFLLHHRYADERDGDKLVFAPEEFSRVTANRDTLRASLYFTPAAHTTEWHFAFGYYWDESLDDIAWRFPNEEAKVIGAFMASIDWDAKPDPGEVADAIRRLKKLGADAGQLREFAETFKSVRNDPVGLAKLGECIAACRAELVANGLKEFNEQKKEDP